MNSMKLTPFKKIILCVVIFLVAGTFFFGNPTASRAQGAIPTCPGCVPINGPVETFLLTGVWVEEKTQTAKETIFDQLAYMAAKIMLQSVTNSVVTWINSGFEGSPAFITDPEAFFTDVADQVAGNFIAGTELGFICEPFNIRLALNLNYSSSYRQTNYCRLSDVISNVEGFTAFTSGDFTQGGWNSWFQITQNPSSNPLGAYIGAKFELDRRIASKLGIEQQKLSWGNGFLSWSDCIAYAPPEGEDLELDENGEATNAECTKRGPIKTPGSVISEQLNITIGSGQRQLEIADKINEIVGALMGQLVQTVFTQGLSSINSGSRGSTSLAQELSVTCAPSVTTATINDNVTWTASVFGGSSGATSYIWNGSENLSGNTSSVVKKYASRGTKQATVTVTRGNHTIVKECVATVSVPDGPEQPPLGVFCSADKARANINETVTWTAQILDSSGNIGETTFVWSGSDPIAGNTTSGNTSSAVNIAYTSQGTKTAIVTATRNGQTISQTCNNVVEINPPLIVTCSPSRTRAQVGQPVTWTADVRGGVPWQVDSTYLWSGSDPIGTNNQRTNRQNTVYYSSVGTKTASILVTRGPQTEIRQCSPNVVVTID